MAHDGRGAFRRGGSGGADGLLRRVSSRIAQLLLQVIDLSLLSERVCLVRVPLDQLLVLLGLELVVQELDGGDVRLLELARIRQERRQVVVLGLVGGV